MIQRLAALVVSFVVLFTVATAFSPVAVADPPDGNLGGWTETNPTHGEAASPFTITYWFGGLDGVCFFSHARFIWNEAQIGSATMNASTCSASLSVPSAPSSDPANYFVSAEGCTNPGGVLTCDSSTNAYTMYMVDPTPTIEVIPTSGAPGDPLSVTYEVPDPGCFYTDTQFYWDGEEIGLPEPMTDCSSTLNLADAPLPNGRRAIIRSTQRDAPHARARITRASPSAPVSTARQGSMNAQAADAAIRIDIEADVRHGAAVLQLFA